MTIREKIKYVIDNPKYILLHFLSKTARIYPDTWFLKTMFKLNLEYELNLKNPQTFNEKLQWLKLYNRKPEYSKMVCKVEAKDYVASVIGEEYIIPTLGVYNSVDEIDFEKLPNQFVLKCTHDSGGIVVCKDKSTLDIEVAKKKLRKGCSRSYFYQNREWPYKNVARRIIAEQYMSNKGGELDDFKIHCFNGIPRFILVCKDRFKDSELTETFFSEKWERLDVRRPKHPNSTKEIEKPILLDQMLHIAKILSKEIPFLRVDFYIINNRIYFGELTFFPASGMTPFEPIEWDYILGSWITLPNLA